MVGQVPCYGAVTVLFKNHTRIFNQQKSLEYCFNNHPRDFSIYSITKRLQFDTKKKCYKSKTLVERNLYQKELLYELVLSNFVTR